MLTKSKRKVIFRSDQETHASLAFKLKSKMSSLLKTTKIDWNKLYGGYILKGLFSEKPFFQKSSLWVPNISTPSKKPRSDCSKGP